ncbi:MAG TPA: hypothetical protein VNX68_04995 [Nitrosopumilaceae archaeon]|jgi:hypothetical protein|nr:hypothetical protein [Nitrosopumilaceae archaeon]
MKYTNLEYLKTISNGDSAFVLKTINSFIEDLRWSMPKIQNQVATENWSGLAASIHTIRPSFSIIGSKVLEDSFKLMEDCVLAKINLWLLPVIVEEVCGLSEKIISELQQEKLL